MGTSCEATSNAGSDPHSRKAGRPHRRTARIRSRTRRHGRIGRPGPGACGSRTRPFSRQGPSLTGSADWPHRCRGGRPPWPRPVTPNCAWRLWPAGVGGEPPPGGSSLSRTLLGREPVVIRDARAIGEDTDGPAGPKGWVSCLGVPVHGGGGQVGVFQGVLDGRPRFWRLSNLSILQGIASRLEHETGDHATDRQLRDSESRLRQLRDATRRDVSGAGTWAWDAVAGTETFDATAASRSRTRPGRASKVRASGRTSSTCARTGHPLAPVTT